MHTGELSGRCSAGRTQELRADDRMVEAASSNLLPASGPKLDRCVSLEGKEVNGRQPGALPTSCVPGRRFQETQRES